MIHWNHRRVDEMIQHKPVHEVYRGLLARTLWCSFTRFSISGIQTVTFLGSPSATCYPCPPNGPNCPYPWDLRVWTAGGVTARNDSGWPELSYVMNGFVIQGQSKFLPYRKVFQHRELQFLSFFFFFFFFYQMQRWICQLLSQINSSNSHVA